MTDKTENQTKDDSSSVQAGDLTKQLQACRDKAGMDIEKAADNMHLSRNLLTALENEAFDELPEPPYVRGYLRSYAKLSDSNPNALIRTYEILRGANPDDTMHHFAPATSMHKVASPTLSPEIIRMMGIAALVALLGLLSMIPAVRNWAGEIWTSFSAQTEQAQQQTNISASNSSSNDTNTASSTSDIAQSAAVSSSLADQVPQVNGKPIDLSEITNSNGDATASNANSSTTSETANAANANTEATGTSGSTDNASNMTATEASDAEKTDKAPEANASTETADADTTNTETSEQANTGTATTENPENNAETNKQADTSTSNTQKTEQANAETAQQTAQPKQPIDGSVAIRLEFIDSVWMEIRDQRGKRLFSSLNSAGTIKELNARTPLSFKIGNAHGVALYLNGQFYDTKPFITRGSVAKFRVE